MESLPNSPIRIIKECIENGIISTPSTGYQPLILQSIKTKLLSSRLNKFNDFEDSFNGLGISVHDISAQKISLLSFQKYAIGWSATIHFVAQDHFGLDVTDIKNKTYSKYRFFAYGSFYNGIKTLLSNLFSPILTPKKLSIIVAIHINIDTTGFSTTWLKVSPFNNIENIIVVGKVNGINNPHNSLIALSDS